MISMFEDGTSEKLTDDQQERLDDILSELVSFAFFDEYGNEYESGVQCFVNLIC